LGIKNSKCRNKALLAKQAWDFTLGSKETWANILRHKYTPIRSFSRRCSSIWKSLCHIKDICEKGKLNRNGKTINFWHDNWLESGPLRALIHGPLRPHEFNMKLCDLWDTQGNWDLNHLSFHFPPDISLRISTTSRPITPNLEDCLFWKPAKNGQFNTSSAYRVAFDKEVRNHLDKDWKWLWRVNSIHTVIFFYGLLAMSAYLPKPFFYTGKSSLISSVLYAKMNLKVFFMHFVIAL
jgi:hypothetical protein